MIFGKKKEDKIKDEDMYSVSENVGDIFISNPNDLVKKSDSNELKAKKTKVNEIVDVEDSDGLMAKKTDDSDGLITKEISDVEPPHLVSEDSDDEIDLKSLSKNQLREYRRTGKIN